MRAVCVTKVGGSLWDFPALMPALRDYLASCPDRVHVLIFGGGAWVDAVRQLDKRFALDPTESHWLAVRLLDVSARFGKLLLPELEFCHDFHRLLAHLAQPAAGNVVFSPEQFLQQVEPHLPEPRLPADWSVTSDSIAARLAMTLHAELVLLKSADPLPPHTARHLAAEGYVDAFFPSLARHLKSVAIMNLRNGRCWIVDREHS
ncbi:MAG: hypothetical protein KatS3mg110_4126 [Pirellulaceae bacterium]|nr:MAG: hypothetical protein KatS3mg110_4126 [Pirellulaceae bacterium]